MYLNVQHSLSRMIVFRCKCSCFCASSDFMKVLQCRLCVHNGQEGGGVICRDECSKPSLGWTVCISYASCPTFTMCVQLATPLQPKTKRDHCIKELMDTEKNYVDALDMIVTVRFGYTVEPADNKLCKDQILLNTA